MSEAQPLSQRKKQLITRDNPKLQNFIRASWSKSKLWRLFRRAAASQKKSCTIDGPENTSWIQEADAVRSKNWGSSAGSSRKRSGSQVPFDSSNSSLGLLVTFDPFKDRLLIISPFAFCRQNRKSGFCVAGCGSGWADTGKPLFTWEASLKLCMTAKHVINTAVNYQHCSQNLRVLFGSALPNQIQYI